MAIEIFNRQENKYIIDEQTRDELERCLADHTRLDAYNRANETYSITNLYYDTDESTLIRTSLQKPDYKEKLRLRAYGVPGPEDTVFLEIKKKLDGRVYKRRSAIRLSDAIAFVASGALPEPDPAHNRQVLKEIAYLLSVYPLKPMLYLAYERRALIGADRPDLRISFDTHIRTRRERLALEDGDDGKPLLPEGRWLMEIKSSGNMPLWLARLLSELKVFPTSFSKYGFEYKSLLSGQPQPDGLIYIPPLIPVPVRALHG